MRGLVSAACLLGTTAVAAPGPRHPGADSTPSALITLYVPPQENLGERQLTLRLDVAEAESPCGPDTNVQINGQRLGRDDVGAGSGSFETNEQVSVRASWNFTCVEWDGEPREQFLALDVDEINGVAQYGAGFVLRFQQTAPVWLSDVEGSASMARVHGQPPEDDQPWDGLSEGGMEYELAEIDYLRSQVADLEEMIADKERHLAEAYGWDVKNGFGECDSIKCIFKTAYNHVHDAAKAFYSDWMDLPDDEHHGKHGRHGKHGKHRRPHHGPPGWGPPHWGHHPGNHTHGNETHPHPPHHGPPFHPPPFCKCPPPPPPHHGCGGHPPPPPFEGPPHHGRPHRGGPDYESKSSHEEDRPKKDHPPKGDALEEAEGFVELELKGTHNEGSDHGPHKVSFGDRPPPPPEEDEEQPITPPDDGEREGHHGHHPPPPPPPDHDDDHRRPPPPHHGGPDHDHPPPPDHDHHGKHGDHRRPPPPPGLKAFLHDPAFAPYKISACVFLLALLLVALHARCTRSRSSSRVSRRQRRRAARRSRCQGGLLRRIMFWRQNTSAPGERDSMLSRQEVNDDGDSDSDSDNMSTTMEQEIAQFRAAASVVGDMVAAEEGRAEAGRQIRELASRQRQREREGEPAVGQGHGQEMQQMQQMSRGDGFVTVPLGGPNNAAARVPTDVQIHLARLPHHPFLGAVPSASSSAAYATPFPSTSPSSSSSSFITPGTSSGSPSHAHSHSCSIELGPLQAAGVPPSPTAAFAELMPRDAELGFDTQLPAYDFEDGPAGSHMVADGMMFSQDGMGGRYVPGCSNAGAAGSADAFGDSKPAAAPSADEGA